MRREFNSEMLVLARELRALTQKELAEQSENTQGFVSRLEHGQKDASDDTIEKLSQVLNVPTSFFFQAERCLGFGLSFVFHRKRSTARMGDLRRLQAEMNLRRIHIARMLRAVPVHTSIHFTSIDVDEHNGDAELIASFVRANWFIPLGPISNLIRMVEGAGGIVFKFPFGMKAVDAMSQWPDDSPPIFFLNSEAPTDRMRWSLAHEIGHIIMHRVATGDIEGEADRFASELLMPGKLIAPQLCDMNLQLAMRLKPYWRVSMQALIRRAKDLGQITASKYSYLCRRVSALGIRKAEPMPIASEGPNLIAQVVAKFQEVNQYSAVQAAAVLDLHEQEFVSMYGDEPPTPSGLRIAK